MHLCGWRLELVNHVEQWQGSAEVAMASSRGLDGSLADALGYELQKLS